MQKIYLSWYILGIAIIFYCLDFFFRISPSLVVSSLMQQYHVSSAGIGIFATAFYLGYVVMQVPAGIILDKCNLQRVFIIAILLCVVAYIVFVIGDDFYSGIVERFVIGLGSAFSFIGALYIAKNYLPQKFFSLVAGITIAFSTLAASGIQYVSALYLSSVNWHVVFNLIATVGLILIIMFIAPGRINLMRMSEVVFTGKHVRNWMTALTCRPLIYNGIIGGMFYLPTSIFAGLWGITLLHVEYHLTSQQSSLAIMLLFLGWGIGSPLIGYIAPRYHNDRVIMLVGAIGGFLLSLVLLYLPHLIAPHVYGLLLLFGLFSSCQVAVWDIFSRIDTATFTGTAIAFTNMIIMLVAAVFHTVVGILINHRYHHLFIKARIVYSLNDYRLALVVIPAAFLVVILFSRKVPVNNYTGE
jgi:MFS family permease